MAGRALRAWTCIITCAVVYIKGFVRDRTYFFISVIVRRREYQAHEGGDTGYTSVRVPETAIVAHKQPPSSGGQYQNLVLFAHLWFMFVKKAPSPTLNRAFLLFVYNVRSAATGSHYIAQVIREKAPIVFTHRGNMFFCSHSSCSCAGSTLRQSTG